MVKFDELVVISYCSHKHWADYGSSYVVDSSASFYATPHRIFLLHRKVGILVWKRWEIMASLRWLVYRM